MGASGEKVERLFEDITKIEIPEEILSQPQTQDEVTKSDKPMIKPLNLVQATSQYGASNQYHSASSVTDVTNPGVVNKQIISSDMKIQVQNTFTKLNPVG